MVLILLRGLRMFTGQVALTLTPFFIVCRK